MKVLQINVTVNSGSTGRIAEDIGKVLLKQGHESYIAYGRGNRTSESKLIKVGGNKDIYLHVLKTRLFDRHGFGSKNATINLIKTIKKIDPNIIHLHNIHGYYINIEILFEFLKEFQKPVVWTFHDCWAFTGHCVHFELIRCEKWKVKCDKCPKKNSYPSSYLFDSSRKNFTDKKRLFNAFSKLTIVTPSYWLQKLVEQSFLKHKVITIHNGVNLDIFKPTAKSKEVVKKYRLDNKKIIIGVASLWSKYKGLEDFKKLRILLNDDWVIVIIGLTQKQFESLPKGILGLLRTENVEELAAWYSAADVFVNPTYSDNFPTTNIEALACGTPVVTYNTGGSPEAIDTHTGIIVDKGDVYGLKKAIEQITSKGKLHFEPLCRKRAEMFFNKDDRYMDYLRIMESLIKGID